MQLIDNVNKLFMVVKSTSIYIAKIDTIIVKLYCNCNLYILQLSYEF